MDNQGDKKKEDSMNTVVLAGFGLGRCVGTSGANPTCSSKHNPEP